MSYSWVDPHFAVLYARREPSPGAIFWREASSVETDAVCRGHFRLL